MQLGVVAVAGLALGRIIGADVPVGRAGDMAAVAAAIGDRETPTSGPADASVRMAVFTDYRCPACRRAFPVMEAAAETDGDVLILYKDWPIFGPISERAARVAVASAQQGIYRAVHQRLMTDRRAVNDAMLRDVVTAAGGNWGVLAAYLTTREQDISARLRANGRQALALGLPGTPGFVAGTTVVVGGMDVSEFARLFAQARSGSSASNDNRANPPRSR